MRLGLRAVAPVSGVILLLVGCWLALGFTAAKHARTAPDFAALDSSVEQGSYLARAGNCATCHTAEGGQPYAGGVAFHTPFGTLFSTNITPDEITGIGTWSFADFYAAMKHGVRPDGTHLYPAFPYTDFAKMSDDDIGSLYAWMQALPAVRQEAPANQLDFPYNQRRLLAGWNLLFHDASGVPEDPAKSAEWNRGAYLVEGPGHCGACHTPRNALGAERASLALTGGSYQDKIRFGYYRQWSGVNLTPDKSGLAAWSVDDIVSYLRDGVSGNAVVHGPMRDVVFNSTSHLSDDDLRAIATYLKDIPANAQPPGPVPSEATLARGETVYTVHCGSCHLPTGKGDAGLGVPLVGSPIVQAPDPSSLINVILYGPHLPPHLVVDRSRMKMFGKRLSSADIASVASYVRSEFGHGAGAVSAAQVEVQR